MLVRWNSYRHVLRNVSLLGCWVKGRSRLPIGCRLRAIAWKKSSVGAGARKHEKRSQSLSTPSNEAMSRLDASNSGVKLDSCEGRRATVDELIRSIGIKSRARLRLVRRPSECQGHRYVPTVPIASAEAGGVHRLISSPDAVISRRLQEQTRIVLATLSAREQQVLRLRFGIAQASDQPQEKIDDVLTPEQLAFIEATALRKLRHPSPSARLKSAERE